MSGRENVITIITPLLMSRIAIKYRIYKTDDVTVRYTYLVVQLSILDISVQGEQ
jgi:hypothetical protein